MKLTLEQIKAKNIFNEKLQSGEYKTVPNPCLCGFNKDISLSKMDRYGIKLETKLCMNCGLVRSDPYYDLKTLKSFYTNEYRVLYTDGVKPTLDFFKDEVKMGENVLNTIEKNLQDIQIKESKVFEVGCGAGGILYPFFQKGAEVYGCDLGNEYLEIGKNKGMNLINGNVDSLQQFGSADIIILHHVLEHFVSPIEELKKIIALLKPKGILYIAVPGLWSHPKTYGTLKEYLQNAHVFSFTKITLTGLLLQLGLTVLYSDEKVVCIAKKEQSNQLINTKENIKKLKRLLVGSTRYPLFFNFYRFMIKLIKKVIRIFSRVWAN